MTTWTDYLTDLRADLQDTGATPRWADMLLLTYTKDAIRDYSTWFPLRVDREEMTLLNGKYSLPSGFIEDIHVECPEGTYLQKRREIPGVKRSNIAKTFYYFTQGGGLYLNHPSDEDVLLTYHSVHDVPTAAVFPPGTSGSPIAATSFTFSIPDMDMELIRLYVKASVFEQMRSRQSSLDRFKVTGARDDNPITPEVNGLMDEYYRKISFRIAGGNIVLVRNGNRK
jgi:hypothetical protein